MEVLKTMDFSSLLPIAESIAGGAIGAGTLKGPLKSLDDWWYYNFGSKTELARQKAELLNAQRLEAYKSDIYEEVKNIPPENVKEPKLDIIGPALEASKYYIDAPELRKMFAKLVASSVDSRKETTTRSAFVEFVKQMSPLDAKLLSILTASSSLPICKINRTLKNGGNVLLKSEILPIYSLADTNERLVVPSTIINLSRMGLVQVSYSKSLMNSDYTEIFSKTPEYLNSIQELEQKTKAYQATKNTEVPTQFSNLLTQLKQIAESTITIEKGTLSVTALGKDFTSICL
ncbi:DUF4393 domain-containing protein [Lactiplantibacillus plantarum]|uniref:DUF4393 domain-containing protein n=2 Tax=Lactiplantibacillus plantarum TaxID=1590 RepID=UPI00223FC34E|nr:DUF4393 domain-containing protein [Lactiplantibacillus plantarum]